MIADTLAKEQKNRRPKCSVQTDVKKVYYKTKFIN